jgi:hypothetical protein
MRITHEEPGRRLEIEETDSRLVGLAILLGLTALVATPWRGVWAMLVHGATAASIDWVPPGIFAAGGLFITLSTLGGKRLERLVVDRLSGRLEWRRSHVLGLLRWGGSVPLEAIEGLTLSLAAPPGRFTTTLRLAFLVGQGSPERRFQIGLPRLESAEKVADFALRLAAASGLPSYRVTLNEGGRFAVEMRRETRPGFERVPSMVGASAAGAASAAAAAAVASERLPPFEPSTFHGDARVTVWEPGREVRFDKGWGAWTLLSPLLLAALLGPLAWLRLPSLHTTPLLPRVVALVMITLVGLLLSLVGWAGFTMGQPRHVRIDWASRELRVETLRGKRVVPLGEVEGVHLRNKSYSTGRARGGMIRTGYWSQVLVRLRAPADPSEELLLQTREFQERPAPPREMALPLARELAKTLDAAFSESGSAQTS